MPQGHEEPPPWTASSGKEQGGKKAGPLECSMRGTADQSPGLEHAERKANSPVSDYPGLNKKEELTVKNTKSTAEAKTRPLGMEDHLGRVKKEEPTTTRSSWVIRGQAHGEEQQGQNNNIK